MTDRIVFQPRSYRDFDSTAVFTTFRVVVETSDLYVKALTNLEMETEQLVRECRSRIEAAIARRPEFLTSLEPLADDSADSAAAARMVRAGRKAGTGPMAAVAGEVAEYVGKRLLEKSAEVIVGKRWRPLHPRCSACGGRALCRRITVQWYDRSQD